MYVLAFDLSTTVVGYSIFKENGDLVRTSYYSFTSDELIERGKELYDLICKLYQECDNNIVNFAIEERLKSFRKGGTNADAMLNTAQLNFLCQYLMKNVFKIKITEINVNTARSKCFPGFHKIARAKKGTKHKEIAFQMAIEQLGEAFFPKKILKSGPRKGLEVYLEEAMDMADSWVIGKAYFKIQ